jgi:uncharacterized YigZ family protein
MAHLPNSIKTLACESEFRLKEKGSTFISISRPIENDEEALSFIHLVRKKYFDATHHCYAFNLAENKFKYSDDGEPNGTAGIRIYNAQKHFDLTNLLTVVIRYFGGTKLGVGPLGKAYYQAAYENLKGSKKINKILHHEIEITYAFSQSNNVHHLISKHALIIRQNFCDEKPKMICLLPSSAGDNLNSEVSILNKLIVVSKTGKSEYI